MTEESRTQKRTILLIEDNPDHAELIRRTLESHQLFCEIDHVADGDAALEYLFGFNERPPGTPDLILLDIRLPRRSGMDVLRAVREDRRFELIPVVVLTTSSNEEDIREAYALHVNSYLVKPFDFQKFRKLLVDLGVYWLFWNRSGTEQ